MRGEAIVIPSSLRPEVLVRIHDGHFGEVKCVERARSSVYWPGYCEQVRNVVAGCSTCQENRHRNPAQPLYPVKLPGHPFEKIGTDLFEFKGVNYLLVVDYFSKWPCVAPLQSLHTTAVLNEMERLFADFGIPCDMISDNGPQFGSAEFRVFCQKKGIRHATSSPEYPESNGMAERTVQTVKERLLKMFQDGRTLWEALAAIRSTPVSGSLPSPAVLLQNRNLRGSLPFAPTALQHRPVNSEVVRKQLQRQQASSSFSKARNTDARSSSLQVGQPVRVLIKHKWIPGTVSHVCSQPNSYVVSLQDGRKFRRNRVAINVARVTNQVVTSSSTGRPQQQPPPPTVPASIRAETTPPPLSTPVIQQPSLPPPSVASDSPFHGFPGQPHNSPEPGGTTRTGRRYLAPPRQLFPK